MIMDVLSYLADFFNTSQINYMYVKLLLFLLFFTLILSILVWRKFFEERAINAVIALTISIFAVWYITEKQIVNYILMPYTLIGFLFLILFPLLIILFFIYRSGANGIVRKIVLLVFGIIFGIIWYKNYQTFSNVQNNVSIGLVFLIVVLILFDNPLHKIFRKR